MRYLLITGGVISGLGKGITASSLGVLLQTHGCKVTVIKIDPYLNQDSGTLSPFEHGECFVLTDGGEVDLDLGNYERFLGIQLSRDNNITTGKIYRKVLKAERRGDYLGLTVQIVPHITDAIINWISSVSKSKDYDVCIIELGGTVGDIESLPFLEALGQMIQSLPFCHVHVSYLPVLKTTNEIKTKPTQESVKNVRRYGLNPDFLCLRCEEDIPQNILDKISKFCGVSKTHILKNVDVSNIYDVPINFSWVIPYLWETLQLPGEPISLQSWQKWKNIASEFNRDYPIVTVGVVGKYTGLRDSYLSLCHAIKHAAITLKRRAIIRFIESSNLNGDNIDIINQCDAIIIPGGFGQRGIEGMILAAEYTRTHNIPSLGICLGMQIMVIEWARNVLGWSDASTTEFNPNTTHTMYVVINPDQDNLGGTMRLGLYPIVPIGSTLKYYDDIQPIERHRHRYKVNPKYYSHLQSGELELSFDKTGECVELVNNVKKRFYLGCQFHPEYQTYPDKPHPLFVHLIKNTI